MSDFIKAGYNPNTLKMLNNCRMFLQVTTLAKITNSTGTHLLPEILLRGQSHPTLTTTSNSNYNWPTQPDPVCPHGRYGQKHCKHIIPSQVFPPHFNTHLDNGPYLQQPFEHGSTHMTPKPIR